MSSLVIDDAFILEYQNYIKALIRRRGIKVRDDQEEIFFRVIERMIKTNTNYDPKRGSVKTWVGFQTRSVVHNFKDHKLRKPDLMDFVVDEYDEEA